MRKLSAVFVCALAALCLAGSAGADLAIGVADDAGKDAPDGGASHFFPLMVQGRLQENAITVRWDPKNPASLSEKGMLDKVIPQALAHGIRPILVVEPNNPITIARSPALTATFGVFLQQVARTYPRVKDYVIGNEPNQPRFWRPQFNPDGSPVAGGAYETLLAAGYDFLKAVDPSIHVIGLALSNHGNDDPRAPSNVSTSPIRFIQEVGAAYRASGRRRPLMDAVAMHPYPGLSTDPLMRGLPWPNVGVVNLDRFKQAIWDAFHGTAQRTIEDGLPIRITEVGWQVGIPDASRPAYTGQENVATTDDATQSAIYTQLLQLLACDPSVQDVLFFHLIDESPLEGYQSGLVRADLSLRPSFSAVQQLISSTAGRCQGTVVRWRHTGTVVGATARITQVRGAASVVVSAEENVQVLAAVVQVPRRGPISKAAVARTLEGGNEPQVNAVRQLASRAYWKTALRVPLGGLLPGTYAVAVQVSATLAPGRTAIFVGPRFSTRVFRVAG